MGDEFDSGMETFDTGPDLSDSFESSGFDVETTMETPDFSDDFSEIGEGSWDVPEESFDVDSLMDEAELPEEIPMEIPEEIPEELPDELPEELEIPA